VNPSPMSPAFVPGSAADSSEWRSGLLAGSDLWDSPELRSIAVPTTKATVATAITATSAVRIIPTPGQIPGRRVARVLAHAPANAGFLDNRAVKLLFVDAVTAAGAPEILG